MTTTGGLRPSRTPRALTNSRVARLPASGIRRFFDLIAGVEGVISLGVGEPDFITPQAFRDAVEENLRQARLLYELVVAHPSLEPLCGPPPLSIVPFRHVGLQGEANAENARLVRALQDDGRVWVALATVDNKVGLRPCFVNFRTTEDDVRALVEITAELGAGLASR